MNFLKALHNYHVQKQQGETYASESYNAKKIKTEVKIDMRFVSDQSMRTLLKMTLNLFIFQKDFSSLKIIKIINT